MAILDGQCKDLAAPQTGEQCELRHRLEWFLEGVDHLLQVGDRVGLLRPASALFDDAAERDVRRINATADSGPRDDRADDTGDVCGGGCTDLFGERFDEAVDVVLADVTDRDVAEIPFRVVDAGAVHDDCAGPVVRVHSLLRDPILGEVTEPGADGSADTFPLHHVEPELRVGDPCGLFFMPEVLPGADTVHVDVGSPHAGALAPCTGFRRSAFAGGVFAPLPDCHVHPIVSCPYGEKTYHGGEGIPRKPITYGGFRMSVRRTTSNTHRVCSGATPHSSNKTLCVGFSPTLTPVDRTLRPTAAEVGR